VSSLEGQLAEAQETLAEETRQKLAAQGKVRQAEDALTSLREQIEEEEDAKKTLETKISTLSAQVGLTRHTLFRHCTHASYVYSGYLAWYNVVLTPRVHSSVKFVGLLLATRATVE